MIRKTRLAAAFAFGAGLTAAGAALAQTGSAALPAATLPSAQSPPPWAQSEALTVRSWKPDPDQRNYSADPPPDSTSGVYLPAAVLGYAKSAVGCVVIGCDDGPQAGGAARPSSGSAEPPANPGGFDPR
jgi:hypothetical protein